MIMNTRLLILGAVTAAVLACQTRVEENDPAVTYTGQWTAQTDQNASGGSYTSSSNGDATVTFRFTGDSLTVLRIVDPTGGWATITIDGQTLGRLQFDFPERRFNVPAIFDGLGPGQHTLVLTVLPDRPNLAAGVNVSIDAFETPVTFAPTDAQNAGLAALNQFRAQLGLGPARLSAPLSATAQAHADYMAQNAFGAGERFGRTGFTGFFFPNRAAYVGCPTGRAKAEVMAQTSDPAAALAYAIGAVYQRLKLVNYSVSDAGFGFSQLNGQNMADFPLVSKVFINPPARLIATYPADKQTNVPLNYVEDLTNDLVPNVPRPLGYAVSLHIYQTGAPPLGADNVPATGTLTDAAGNTIPTRLVWTQNDPNGQIRDRNNYFLIPLQPLAANTTYQARLAGLDNSFNKFDQTWTFTTGAN